MLNWLKVRNSIFNQAFNCFYCFFLIFLIFHIMPGIAIGNVEVEIEQVGFVRILIPTSM